MYDLSSTLDFLLMPFSVYYSDKGKTTDAGFGRAAHLPCIFDSRPGYHRISSRYLLDRGLGLWNPITRNGITQGHLPSDQTMLNYAHWLVNFLEWAETRGVDLAECSYREHVHGRYQLEMLNGMWSRNGVALAPRTINLRVQQACDFLLWMQDNGHRNTFELPYKTILIKRAGRTSSIGHLGQEVLVRKGKVHQRDRSLVMPTNEKIKIWLKEVYETSGYARGLMCETILLTGLRREETSCLRIDTLPLNPAHWRISKPDTPYIEQRVQIEISFGAKGPCYGYDHGDKVGPRRSIWLPLHLAERIHAYRLRLRNPGLKVWINSAECLAEKRRRVKESVHLFIDENSGRPLSAKDLYNAWRGADLPIRGWAPHQGRHWWACSTLWQELKKHEKLEELNTGTAAALLESNALSILRLQIQPQLGHVRDSTTIVYLRWAIDMLGTSLPILYESDH